MAWPWNRGRGLSRSLKMTPFDRPYDFLLVRYCKYSSIMYIFSVIWRRVISWPWNLGQRSLKIIQTGTIQKIGCSFLFVFHSNYDRIFNRLWDIQRQIIAWLWKLVRSRSRSLKMAPFDTTLWLYLVPFLSYLTLNNIVTLKSGLEVTQGHSKWHNSKVWVRFPIRLP